MHNDCLVSSGIIIVRSAGYYQRNLRRTIMNKNEIVIDLSESPMRKIGEAESAQQSLPQGVFSAIWDRAERPAEKKFGI